MDKSGIKECLTSQTKSFPFYPQVIACYQGGDVLWKKISLFFLSNKNNSLTLSLTPITKQSPFWEKSFHKTTISYKYII